MQDTIQAITVFNMANGCLRSARYAAERNFFAEALGSTAAAHELVRLLQIGNPSHGEADPPSSKMSNTLNSFNGVADQFKYQMERWKVTADMLDDGLWTED